jgi:hypothetical protein
VQKLLEMMRICGDVAAAHESLAHSMRKMQQMLGGTLDVATRIETGQDVLKADLKRRLLEILAELDKPDDPPPQKEGELC